MEKPKTIRWHTLLIAFVVIVLMGIITTIILPTDSQYGIVFETNNIADYGKITGNFDNDSPSDFVFSFFPKIIEQQFSNVNYHYKAISGDTYAYEVWLEFLIDDQSEFDSYVNNISEGKRSIAFPYDEKFYVFPITDTLHIEKHKTKYWIQYAEIGKILVSESEHRIIYVAIGVYDGGGTTTEELNYYWSRFNIEPYA